MIQRYLILFKSQEPSLERVIIYLVLKILNVVIELQNLANFLYLQSDRYQRAQLLSRDIYRHGPWH
jgi:hypothetical protein